MKIQNKQTKKSLFMLTIVAIVVILFSACHKNCYDFCDEYTTEQVSLSGEILGVIVEGPWSVYITQNDTDNSALLEYCVGKKVKVTSQHLPNGYLKIRVTTRGATNIQHDDFKATIVAASLEKIEGSGATKISTYGHFSSLSNISLSGASGITGLSGEGNTLNIELSGASSLKDFTFEGKKIDAFFSGASVGRFDIEVENFKLDCSGASSINCKGYAAKTTYNGSGASNLKTLDLESESLDIDLSGASSAEATVNNSIKGRLSGASILKYKRATDVNVHCSGESKIIKLD